jgi:hypothetical protein
MAAYQFIRGGYCTLYTARFVTGMNEFHVST